MPKYNLNGFKHGRRSRQLAEVVMQLAANPTTRDTLVAVARQAWQKQEKAEEAISRFFINAITKGLKIENPQQAQLIIDLIREMGT